MEFVRRSDIQKEFHPVVDVSKSTGTMGITVYDLANIESVDAVEVVRCRDCIYHSQLGYCSNGKMLIEPIASYASLMVDDDFFCAFGERRNAYA